MSYPNQRLSVIGLGKLGSPLAAILAAKGYTVVGVDLNAAAVAAINAGEPPVQEPLLAETLAQTGGRLTATTDTVAAVRETDVTFMIVPTPSGADGRFSTRYVEAVVDDIATALRAKDGYHLVVLTSTVMPGDTQIAVVDRLEAATGKRCGVDFGVCYNPEFIAIGNVIRHMLNPDFLLIGESDARAGELLASLYGPVCDNEPSVARMNLVNAELTKISVNTYITMKISYANTLGELCEALPGADAAVVADAVGRDTRIGRKYLAPALGFGGPCFPRDTVAFAALGAGLGVDAALATATDVVNDRQVARLVQAILAQRQPGETVAVLGLSYRPDTGLTVESQALQIATALAAEGAVVVYDPQAMPEVRGQLGERVQYAESAAAALAAADVAVLATPWREFATLDWGPVRLVFDCWGMVPDGSHSHIIRLGKGPATRAES